MTKNKVKETKMEGILSSSSYPVTYHINSRISFNPETNWVSEKNFVFELRGVLNEENQHSFRLCFSELDKVKSFSKKLAKAIRVYEKRVSKLNRRIDAYEKDRYGMQIKEIDEKIAELESEKEEINRIMNGD